MTPRDPIKVYDARWEVGEFSDDDVRRLFAAALSYGRLLGVDTVTLCRDARLGAGHVLELGTEVALDAGMRVYLRADPISTPQSYFTTLFVTREHRQTMGLTVTASHNPREYVGIKFTVPVLQAIGVDCGPLGGLTRVRELYHGPQRPERGPRGELHSLDLSREYLLYSMKIAGVQPGRLEGLSVVLDGLHGSAGPEVADALEQAGVQVESLRLEPDGNFPTGLPNPTSLGRMDEAIELARTKNCLAVIGLDGDGDRVVFGGQRGLLTAGFAFVPVLGAWDIPLPPATPVSVICDPKISPVALAEWGRLNARAILFRAGHSHIKDYMGRTGALAGVEESGHFYHRLALDGLEACCENSLYTVLSFLRELHTHPEEMERVTSLEEQVFTTGEFNYRFPDDAIRDRALESLVAHFRRLGMEILTSTPGGEALDGTCVRRGVHLEPGGVNLDDDWLSGYLRVSSNEKTIVRSYFAAGDTAIGKKAESETREILERGFAGQIVP